MGRIFQRCLQCGFFPNIYGEQKKSDETKILWIQKACLFVFRANVLSTVILFREDFLAEDVDIIYEIQQKVYEQAKTFFTREVLNTTVVSNHLVKKLLACKFIWTSYIVSFPIREKK